jgi:hypothetical protein
MIKNLRMHFAASSIQHPASSSPDARNGDSHGKRITVHDCYARSHMFVVHLTWAGDAVWPPCFLEWPFAVPPYRVVDLPRVRYRSDSPVHRSIFLAASYCGGGGVPMGNGLGVCGCMVYLGLLGEVEVRVEVQAFLQ